jgi:Zn finger protein HypA/HybF involved in hydrogenase expression
VTPDEIAVFVCRLCGDTFPSPTGEAAVCPSCGGGEVEIAAEPLL